ncbi:MAG: IS3 family transposase, partial [Candidatus Thiodiazotropha sp.]
RLGEKVKESHEKSRGSYGARRILKDLLDDEESISRARVGRLMKQLKSFFHTLKTELIYHRRYQTRQQAKQDIFEYIEVFYNRQRRHSTIGYQTPLDYDKAYRDVA